MDKLDTVTSDAKRMKLSPDSIPLNPSERPAKVLSGLGDYLDSENDFDGDFDATNYVTQKIQAEHSEYVDRFTYRVGIDEDLNPICSNGDIFADMTKKALELGLDKFLGHINGRKLKVATMCSGTESPILALQLVSKALKRYKMNIDIKHLFSAEIVPFKQAYIERNFQPPIIFRDIKELSILGATHATTAYGGRAKIPDGVDLLVAGFSCVDFSCLNNEKKTMKDGGESGDTFSAIMDYADMCRPKIIILENVSGAPWAEIKTTLATIGYSAEFVRADTKNYYIPHTRVRGYMVCLDSKSTYDLTGEERFHTDLRLLKPVLAAWKSTMVAFQRPASCSVEAFLLDEDDDRVIRGRAELSNPGRGDFKRTRENDWARCHGRHQDYRAALLLGQKRPLTKWEDGGLCKPADNMWVNWAMGQVERVLDAVDISWLRNLMRGFDQQFKFRILELSQNVDRVTDNMKSGLVGCITPTGIPFSTMRGGPLIGLEALALQGLPIDQLQLSRERQAQLQDLAGNAMSSTVVGAAILAALIAAHKILEPGGNDDMDVDLPDQVSYICGEHDLVPFGVDLAAYEPVAVVDAINAAARSIRLCICEGRKTITKTALQHCDLCKHTTCISCGGNPAHHFSPLKLDQVAQRVSPAVFPKLIKKAIPMKIILSGISGDAIRRLYEKKADSDGSEIIYAVQMAVSSELRFRSTKRSEVWIVSYESQHASMELFISSQKAEWRLFAKPSPAEPVNSKIRQTLSLPVARMRPTRDDLTIGAWQLRLPEDCQFDISVTGCGQLTRSFENVQGLGNSADMMAWTEIDISVPCEASSHLDADISGKYKLLQDCGTASGSLHIQNKTAESSRPLFLFLDPHRLHDPVNDYFVFSTDKRRLNYGETRSCVARIDSSWRPQKLEKIEDKYSAEINYKFNGSEKIATLSESQVPVITKCYVDCRWVDFPKASLKGSTDRAGRYSSAASTLSISGQLRSCQNSHVILNCEASLPRNEDSTWEQNQWIQISPTDYKEFFEDFAWMTEKACTQPAFNEWRDVEEASYIYCPTCAPKPPAMRWKLETPKIYKAKASKKITGSANSEIFKTNEAEAGGAQAENSDTEQLQPLRTRRLPILGLMAFEDPAQAAAYESALKNRPSPMETQVLFDTSGLVKLRISVNFDTLVHRASAKLMAPNGNSPITCSWRLTTGQSVCENAVLPLFTLKNNNNDPGASKPPGFLHNLRLEQSRSLAWMIRQESDEVKSFVEEEIEEVIIPQIGWCAEGRARKSVLVRGGVLADQVGYGKTVTTLALIDTQRRRDTQTAKMSVKGSISLKATLILVPPQLPSQWDQEVKKFLRKDQKYRVLVIKTAVALEKLTITDFQEADIIIASWKVLEGDNYLFKIAQFAGMVELPEKSTRRGNAIWYEHALQNITSHVDELKAGGQNLHAIVTSLLVANEEKASSEETFIPSKRLRGQAYQNAKEASRPKAKRKYEDMDSDESAPGDHFDSEEGKTGKGARLLFRNPRVDTFCLQEIAAGKRPWTTMKCPLFELFEFSRIVVDEFTYVTGQECLIIPNLKAKFRWILSATPPLEDFADVKCISKLLGINLGIDDVTPGIIKASTIRVLEKERTESEKFWSFKPVQSSNWHVCRHLLAQRFLDQFARQNIANIDVIPGSTHTIPVRLPAAEWAIYLELLQLLLKSDSNLKRCKLSTDNDRLNRVQELLGESSSAGEALMKCASHFTLDDLNVRLENAPQACEIIVRIRSGQYEKLKNEFKRKLKQTEWLVRDCSTFVKQYSLWKGHVCTNQFGDIEVMKEIQALIQAAENGYDENDWKEFYLDPQQKAKLGCAVAITAKSKKKSYMKSKCKGKAKTKKATDASVGALSEDETCEIVAGSETRHVKPQGLDRNKREASVVALRDAANDLRKLSSELVNRHRGLRFFEFVRHLQTMGSSKEGCFCSKCARSGFLTEDISILLQCGHAICSWCMKSRIDECPVNGCNAVNRSYQVIEARELGVEDDATRIGRHYGKKLEEIVSLIHCVPEDDQVLLFVQFPDLLKKIMCIFEEMNITFLALGDGADASKKLTEFQTNVDCKTKKKVLLLNIGDASAAGSNLTNANHVIFVSPFLTDSQQLYDQAVTQAMGRARRYGQMKPVHIYNFVSLKTIDVNTLQERSGKILAKNVALPPEHIPFQSFVPSLFGLVDGRHGDCGEFGWGGNNVG